MVIWRVRTCRARAKGLLQRTEHRHVGREGNRRSDMNSCPAPLPRATPWRSLPCPRAELRLDLVLSGGQTFRLVRPLAAPRVELQAPQKAFNVFWGLGVQEVWMHNLLSSFAPSRRLGALPSPPLSFSKQSACALSS